MTPTDLLTMARTYTGAAACPRVWWVHHDGHTVPVVCLLPQPGTRLEWPHSAARSVSTRDGTGSRIVVTPSLTAGLSPNYPSRLWVIVPEVVAMEVSPLDRLALRSAPPEAVGDFVTLYAAREEALDRLTGGESCDDNPLGLLRSMFSSLASTGTGVIHGPEDAYDWALPVSDDVTF